MTDGGEQRNKLARLSNPEMWRVSTVKLLIALVLLFALTPFIEDLPNGNFIESGLVTLVMVASLVARGSPSSCSRGGGLTHCSGDRREMA